MIDTLYIEESVSEHPRSLAIKSRFPDATVINCQHYKEIFNPSGQSFRLQKKKPALILAKQTGKLVHPIPPSYGVGGTKNYYFSHLLNCLYDCRYCFLQGMYPSAHYLLFINYEDFEDEITKLSQLSEDSNWFFSGYDCDSLALESITGFAKHFLPFFKELPNAWIELRTKSVATKILDTMDPFPSAVVAFSFTPQEVSKQVERGVPSVNSRIGAMKKLAEKGWKLGLRFDPLIECEGFKNRYDILFKSIFDSLPHESIHSVSLGTFRMPAQFYKKIEKQYPEESLFAGNFTAENGSVGYLNETEKRLIEITKNLLVSRVDPNRIYTCEIL